MRPTHELVERHPDRDLILFITFGVIVVTLVGQGLLLPSVVRWLGLGSHAAEERARARSRAFRTRGSTQRGAKPT